MNRIRRFGLPLLFSVAVVTVGATLSLASGGPKGNKADVDQAFVFFGCNRIDQKDYEATAATNPSSANVPQLNRTLSDIARLAPDNVFFGGDLVMGYGDDNGQILAKQMTAWIALVNSCPRSPKSAYIAMGGNHEMKRKHGPNKLANPATDPVWAKLVHDVGLVPKDAKGPTATSSPEDNLVDDQRLLNFSINRGSVHFVVLNTDTRVSVKYPMTGETKIGMIPAHWLDKDLDEAEKNSKIKAVIVMGHRNVIDPLSCKGDAPIDDECAKPMVASLKKHHKVRAYVCAHVHAFDITPIGKKGLLQVCFGNGGSILEKDWSPARGRTFGFGYFKIYKDGSLGVVPYLRPEPKNYQETNPDLVPAAKPEPEVIIPVR
ncbi:MAG: metallophosphoesterase [Chthonomonadales bacterium]